MCNFEKTSINIFMFCNPSNNFSAVYLTSPITAFKGMHNQRYIEIMKRRDQHIRCVQFLHLFKKRILFERTKPWNNIFAKLGFSNNSKLL
ncbi:LOW QUALITY PROTEIN: hypothetical protein HZS_5650 [Henneguya salminicola]|nr:LOW QUALITY PROTEIN: hypothetical protein HZS_5650 [Henneguya salminicola]